MVLYCWNMIDVFINKDVNYRSDLNGLIMVNSLDMNIFQQVVMFITPIMGHKWLFGKSHKYWLATYTLKIRSVFSFTSETNEFCTSKSWHPVQCSLSFRAMMYTAHRIWIPIWQTRKKRISIQSGLARTYRGKSLVLLKTEAIVYTCAAE